MPTNNVENSNCTNKERDLRLAKTPRIVPRGIERMRKKVQRHRRATLHWSTYPQWEKDETEKSSYGLDWQQKGKWYDPTKLDNKLPQNVQNIRLSHKLYRENHENLESWIDSRWEKLSWSEEVYSRRCSITITICNSDDTTQPHTQEMHSRIQT